MARIVLDASTPKDVLIIKYLIPLLEEKGHEYIVVSRESTQTTGLLDRLGIRHVLTGWYGTDIVSKYRATLEQETRLLEVFQEYQPDLVWSHGNVAVIRTAYQLGIPLLYSNDTPHNIPVVKLTASLATRLVSPEAVAPCKWVEHGADPCSIRVYRGTEEYTWAKDYINVDRERLRKEFFEEPPERLIIFRGVEHKASYSYGATVPIREIVERISRYAHVAVIPRYGEEETILDGLENVTIIREAVEAPRLIASADMVVSSGGTMAREAGIMGVPTISFYFRDDVLIYLMGRGLPIRYVPRPDRIEAIVSRVMRDPDTYREDTEYLVRDFENHVEVLVEEVDGILSTR